MDEPFGENSIRLAVYSDLHLEFAYWDPPRGLNADLVVLAGDIDVGVEGIRWAIRAFHPTPVVYVAGNHEFYRQDLARLPGELWAAARDSNVHFLEKESLSLTVRDRKLTLLGTTMWTDFALAGKPESAMIAAPRRMNDYARILNDGRGLEPKDLLERFRESHDWLDSRLGQAPSDETLVVVTHHAPSAQSLDAEHAELGPFYASDLSALVHKYQPDLWIHGHTHSCHDYPMGRTRVVSNQRGYVGIGKNRAVADFYSACVVEI